MQEGLSGQAGVQLYESRCDLAEPLYPDELEHIRRAVPKRFNEFCTVRALVRRGLKDFGLPRPSMVPGERGEPRWPMGVVGSITHCQGYRAVAIGRSCEVRGVGIDAEPNHPLPGGVYQRISSADERAAADQVEVLHPDVCGDKVLLSAKEAVFKAWFPLERTLLGFEQVQIILSPDGLFTAAIRPSAPRQRPVGGVPARLSGHWDLSEGILRTAVVLPSRETD